MTTKQRTELVKLNPRELDDLIDREARSRLGLSAKQFKAYWRRGALRDREAAHEIAMLLSLNGKD